ncbi:hypothetical protein V2G26_019939 [Clonostachys chloroleuca]
MNHIAALALLHGDSIKLAYVDAFQRAYSLTDACFFFFPREFSRVRDPWAKNQNHQPRSRHLLYALSSLATPALYPASIM